MLIYAISLASLLPPGIMASFHWDIFGKSEGNAMSILSTAHLTKQYGQEPNTVKSSSFIWSSWKLSTFTLPELGLLIMELELKFSE